MQVTPKFCKQYAQVGRTINEGLHAFRADVEAGSYPDKATSPYKITAPELDAFMDALEGEGLSSSASAAAEAAQFAGL
jgi:3-methyl-2-oxobutanoate hydroxymethyltransferase